MKKMLFVTGACFSLLLTGCGPKPAATEVVKLDQPTVVDAACGHCQLEMKEEKDCSLAIRYDGTSYYVDGFKLTDLGDPHANDGLCSKVHKAKVTGQIVNGRFAASTFELLPAEKP